MKGLDGVAGKRVSDDAVVAAYRQTGNVHAAARLVGLTGGTVHERLVRLGIERSSPQFTGAERERLRREYLIFRDAGQLKELAKAMGRTVPFLCRQARELGLTDQGAAKQYLGKWKYMTEEAARVMFDRFHRQRKSVHAYCKKLGIEEGSFGRTMRRFFPDEWDGEIESHQPKQSLYRFGRQFEYRVRDHLREFGYFCLRSPQSKSPLDLIALRKGVVLLVQCKRDGTLGVEGWNDLLELAVSVGAVPLLAEVSEIGRGRINYWRLLASKDGTKKAQPRGAFLPEHA